MAILVMVLFGNEVETFDQLLPPSSVLKILALSEKYITSGLDFEIWIWSILPPFVWLFVIMFHEPPPSVDL